MNKTNLQSFSIHNILFHIMTVFFKLRKCLLLQDIRPALPGLQMSDMGLVGDKQDGPASKPNKKLTSDISSPIRAVSNFLL